MIKKLRISEVKLSSANWLSIFYRIIIEENGKIIAYNDEEVHLDFNQDLTGQPWQIVNIATTIWADL